MFTVQPSAEMLFEEAKSRGHDPRWESPCGLFSYDISGRTLFVYYTKLHLNSQLGGQICAHKGLSRAFLQREGFRNIPYCYSNKIADINRFFDAHHPLVQKPVKGMKSRGVRLIERREQIDETSIGESIFEQFIEGTEHRYLVFKGSVIAVQRKTVHPTEKHPWKKRVETLAPDLWDAEIAKTALSIAETLRMGLLAVDFLIDDTGQASVLELNGMPGLYAFHHPDAGPAMNLAGIILEEIER